jgi:hypothetical protein
MNVSVRQVAMAALALVSLVACDESRVVGTLTTSSTLRIVSPGGNKQVLNPGSYRAALRIEPKGGGQVFITASGKEVTFKIPNLSATSETIRVSAATLRQEFGLSGRVYVTQSPFDRVVSQSCVYGTERRLVCHDRRDGERRREDCDWETVTITGYQKVREIGYSSVRNINIDLVNTASQKVGNYRGSVNLGDTVTDSDTLTSCIPEYNRYP